jgi:hypothetical protein
MMAKYIANSGYNKYILTDVPSLFERVVLRKKPIVRELYRLSFTSNCIDCATGRIYPSYSRIAKAIHKARKNGEVI